MLSKIIAFMLCQKTVVAVLEISCLTRFSDESDRFISRLTVSAKCPMDFSRYPMDSQKCLVEFGSCKYNKIHHTFAQHETATFECNPQPEVKKALLQSFRYFCRKSFRSK